MTLKRARESQRSCEVRLLMCHHKRQGDSRKPALKRRLEGSHVKGAVAEAVTL